MELITTCEFPELVSDTVTDIWAQFVTQSGGFMGGTTEQEF